jgi:hypothetical protein
MAAGLKDCPVDAAVVGVVDQVDVADASLSESARRPVGAR